MSLTATSDKSSDVDVETRSNCDHEQINDKPKGYGDKIRNYPAWRSEYMVNIQLYPFRVNLEVITVFKIQVRIDKVLRI